MKFGIHLDETSSPCDKRAELCPTRSIPVPENYRKRLFSIGLAMLFIMRWLFSSGSAAYLLPFLIDILIVDLALTGCINASPHV
jgi:hypothetical protein